MAAADKNITIKFIADGDKDLINAFKQLATAQAKYNNVSKGTTAQSTRLNSATTSLIAKLTAQQIAVSHFNDVPADPPREQQHDKDRVWPGDGIFDLRRYPQLIEETGYQGYLSLELFREDHWAGNPYDVVAEGYDKMLRVVNG